MVMVPVATGEIIESATELVSCVTGLERCTSIVRQASSITIWAARAAVGVVREGGWVHDDRRFLVNRRLTYPTDHHSGLSYRSMYFTSRPSSCPSAYSKRVQDPACHTRLAGVIPRRQRFGPLTNHYFGHDHFTILPAAFRRPCQYECGECSSTAIRRRDPQDEWNRWPMSSRTTNVQAFRCRGLLITVHEGGGYINPNARCSTSRGRQAQREPLVNDDSLTDPDDGPADDSSAVRCNRLCAFGVAVLSGNVRSFRWVQ